MDILRRATDLSPLAFLVIDSSGNIVSANLAGAVLFGFDENEFIGLFIQTLYPTQLKSNQPMMLSDFFQDSGGSKTQFENTVRWQIKNGNVIFTEVATSKFEYQGQQFVVANIIDVTHEYKLRKLMERTQEVAKIGSWYVDLRTNQAVWSKMTYQIHELDPQTPICIEDGINFYAVAHRPIIRQCVEEGINQQKGWDVELKILTAKHNERWVRAIGEPIIESGQVVGIEGTFQDIHDQKTIQLDRESLLNKLEQTESLAKLGHWELFLGPEKVTWSESLYNIWGLDSKYPPPDLEQHRRLIHSDDQKLFFYTIAKNIKNQTEYKMVFRIIVNQAVKFIQAEGKPLYNESGLLVGYFGTAQDITAVKESEAKLKASNLSLERANEELTQFAYRTSHDLKAPLTTIKGLTTFMKEDLTDKNYSEVHSNIDKVHYHADRLVDLVEDILNLTKADLSTEAVKAVNLFKLMTDIKTDFEYELELKQVSCDINIDQSTEIQTEVVRLRQIVENLILNGIKYCDQNKVNKFVNISVEINDTIDIIVSDNGLGIPEKYHHQLFDMFTRFHTGEAQGSGLGLSIVKKHVAALNGHIYFDSSKEGTHFTLALPK